MPLFKNIKENNCLISIWYISETLDYLNKNINSGDIKKTTNIERQKEILATRMLLKEMVPNIEIRYNKYGAPIVKNGKFISISHSKLFITIILSSKKVGIDIQEVNYKALKVASKFIDLNTHKQLTKEKATLIWSCKEALFKHYQKGSVNFLNDIKIQPFEIKGKGEIKADFKNQEFTLFYRKLQKHFLVYVCK